MFSRLLDACIGWLFDFVMSRLAKPMLKWVWKRVKPFAQVIGLLMMFRLRRFLPRTSRELITMGTTIVLLVFLAEQVRKSKALAGS